MFQLLFHLHFGDGSTLDTFITGIHAGDRFTMPLQIYFRQFMVADAIDKFINQSDPFIKIGVLNGITVIRCAVMVDIGTETIALDHSFFAGDGKIDLHSLGETFPAGAGYFEPFFKA